MKISSASFSPDPRDRCTLPLIVRAQHPSNSEAPQCAIRVCRHAQIHKEKERKKKDRNIDPSKRRRRQKCGGNGGSSASTLDSAINRRDSLSLATSPSATCNELTCNSFYSCSNISLIVHILIV